MHNLTCVTIVYHTTLQDKLQVQAKTLKEVGADSGGLETHTNQQFWFMQQAMAKLEQKMVVMSKRGRGPPAPTVPRTRTKVRMVNAIKKISHPKEGQRQLENVQRLVRREGKGRGSDQGQELLAQMRDAAQKFKEEVASTKREIQGRYVLWWYCVRITMPCVHGGLHNTVTKPMLCFFCVVLCCSVLFCVHVHVHVHQSTPLRRFATHPTPAARLRLNPAAGAPLAAVEVPVAIAAAVAAGGAVPVPAVAKAVGPAAAAGVARQVAVAAAATVVVVGVVVAWAGSCA